MDVSELGHNLSKDEKERVGRAYAFAEKAHKGQTRKSGESYVTHPFHVARTLAEFNVGADIIVAGLLHDVLEESTITEEELRQEFGDDISFLVQAVTKLENVNFVGEEELAENFRKMVLATAKDIRVILIKLADVLHNLETLDALPQVQQSRYAREVLEIYGPLAARLGMGDIKGRSEERRVGKEG